MAARDAARAEEGYAIVIGLFISAGENKGGFLAKRTSNSAEGHQAAKVKRPARAAVREYVPIEDDPTVSGSAPEGAAGDVLLCDPDQLRGQPGAPEHLRQHSLRL